MLALDNDITFNEEEEEIWEDLKEYSRYEISRKYPYPIRNKTTNKILKTNINHDGYKRIGLTSNDGIRKKCQLHRLIAKQWITNPDPIHKKQVDHINRDRLDNHISNLRWASSSENTLNKSGYLGYSSVWIKELPLSAEPFIKYNDHYFTNVFIDKENKKLYKYNGVSEYRTLKTYHDKKNPQSYIIKDSNNKLTNIPCSRIFGSSSN